MSSPDPRRVELHSAAGRRLAACFGSERHGLCAALLALCVAWSTACAEHGHGDQGELQGKRAAAGGGHGHVHVAPHGGALVVLGDDFAHVEFVLEPATGTLTAYVLDGHADRSLRLATAGLELQLLASDEGPVRLSLAGRESALTGEVLGDTSEFVGRHAALVGAERFEGVLQSITVKGQPFNTVRFRYPEGNAAAEPGAVEAGDHDEAPADGDEAGGDHTDGQDQDRDP